MGNPWLLIIVRRKVNNNTNSHNHRWVIPKDLLVPCNLRNLVDLLDLLKDKDKDKDKDRKVGSLADTLEVLLEALLNPINPIDLPPLLLPMHKAWHQLNNPCALNCRAPP